MELRHRQLSSTPSTKRLAPQPGTSQSVARLVPLPDTSSGDSDDIWANPDYEQRGSIAHLAVQGVGLKGPGPMSPEINVTKARGPHSVYSEPGDGNFNGERHGTAVQAGHRSPVCYSGAQRGALMLPQLALPRRQSVTVTPRSGILVATQPPTHVQQILLVHIVAMMILCKSVSL